jgi:tetratricopeptide (TPR) repeat protein
MAVTVQAVRGMGGIGKTQTTVEYAHRHAADYEVAWWIRAERPALVAAQLADLGQALGLPADPDPDSAASAVCAELRVRRRWLLVFDNAETAADLRPFLPQGAGHVLISTRRAGFRALGPVLDLDVLERAASIALLRRRVPDLSDTQAEALAEQLGDLPLALEQAASYIEHTGTQAADYLTLLQTHGHQMHTRGTAASSEHTIATVWKVSMDRLTAEHPAAVGLLGVCAYLAPEPIPLELFTRHHDLLPEPLAEAAADPLKFTETVGALVDYSLARRTDTGLLLHRLIQAVGRTHLPEQATSLSAALHLLHAQLPTDLKEAPENWPAWRQYIPHILAATTHRDDTDTTNADETSWLLDCAAHYLQVHAQPAAARSLLERALHIYETVYGPDDPNVAILLHNLAAVLRDLGEPAAARPLLERALRIDEGVRGPENLAAVMPLNNLAAVLRDLGEPGAARPLAERALHIAETAYSPDHPTVATALSNLALALRDLGQPAAARPLLERALCIGETTHGPDHPTVAIRLTNLGVIMQALGEPTAARPLVERALRVTEAVYGPDHPAVARLLSNLATVLLELGEPAAARPLAERALHIAEAAFAPDHHEVAVRLNNLASVVCDLGEPAAARPLVERALRIKEAVYGPDHPAIATSLGTLAAVLRDLGQPAAARPLAERALRIAEAAHGPDHPTVATRRANLRSLGGHPD